MKVSELPHLDSAWGYLELKDGSLVALPKDAIEELQAEIERLKAENAKLKCLALHAMNDLFFEKQNTASRDGSCALSWEDKAKCDKRGGKYLYYREKCLEAYRKAKKALMEG